MFLGLGPLLLWLLCSFQVVHNFLEAIVRVHEVLIVAWPYACTFSVQLFLNVLKAHLIEVVCSFDSAYIFLLLKVLVD